MDEYKNNRELLINEITASIDNSTCIFDESSKNEIINNITQRIIDNTEQNASIILKPLFEIFEENIKKNCVFNNPIILKNDIILKNGYTITVHCYNSAYDEQKFLYYYYKLKSNDNNDVTENWDIVANNQITLSILQHISMTDDELTVFDDPIDYRKKLCSAIDSLWD